MVEQYIQANQLAKDIQTIDIQAFILKNRKKYDSNLLHLVADQWLARRKAKHKLPTWYANENVIFPPPLSVEQASSEITANYKAQVFFDFVKNETNKNCIDLTGGMGLDTFALAQVFGSVIYVEQNPLLAQIAKYNFEVLRQKNINVINENSVLIPQLKISPITNFYLDPHRRDTAKNKVFKIEDCEPNLLTIKHLFENYMVKFSPMLDIKLALEVLENVVEVHVVSVENEVKELLFLGKKSPTEASVAEASVAEASVAEASVAEASVAQPSATAAAPIRRALIKCVNFLSNNQKQIFEFDYETEQNTNINYSKPSKYIYEPNAAIMKAGAFKSVATYFKINKIAPNSHLYTSENLVENFSGRIFYCKAVCKFDKKEILTFLPDKKANISTRNFPMKPDEVKKKLGLQDGGEFYLFATETFEKQKIALICMKI